MDRNDRIVPPGTAARLIVNADDFGRSREVNEAVARAHDDGILTSASLMVTAEAAAEAVIIARQRPHLAVGLHLVAVRGRPILPPAAIPHVVGSEGRFPRGAFRAGVRYALSRRTREELAREIRAQFEAFRATGLPLSHVDGHHHMHLHPNVFPLLLPLAREFGARGIRVSVADELLFSLRSDCSHLRQKLGWKIAFFFLSAHARRLLRRLPVPAAHRVYGLMQTGRLSETYLGRLFHRVGAAGRTNDTQSESPVIELFCHPSLKRETKGLGPNPGDLAALVSPAVRRSLEDNRIELTTYPLAFPLNADVPSAWDGPRPTPGQPGLAARASAPPGR